MQEPRYLGNVVSSYKSNVPLGVSIFVTYKCNFLNVILLDFSQSRYYAFNRICIFSPLLLSIWITAPVARLAVEEGACHVPLIHTF